MLPQTDLTTLALRIAARPNLGAWSLVLVPPGSSHAVAGALASEVASLGQGTIVHCDASRNLRALAHEVASNRGAAIVVTGLEVNGWPALDLARSLFEGAAEVIVVASAVDGIRLVSDAPHFASWFGPNIYSLDLAADDAAERERTGLRLAALRSRFRMTDAEVIEKAEKHTVPLDPEIVEWLVLLGRSDLV